MVDDAQHVEHRERQVIVIAPQSLNALAQVVFYFGPPLLCAVGWLAKIIDLIHPANGDLD